MCTVVFACPNNVPLSCHATLLQNQTLTAACSNVETLDMDVLVHLNQMTGGGNPYLATELQYRTLQLAAGNTMACCMCRKSIMVVGNTCPTCNAHKICGVCQKKHNRVCNINH